MARLHAVLRLAFHVLQVKVSGEDDGHAQGGGHEQQPEEETKAVEDLILRICALLDVNYREE